MVKEAPTVEDEDVRIILRHGFSNDFNSQVKHEMVETQEIQAEV